MPNISLIYLTYRPGSYDLLAHSLINQTYTDYELIIVDEMTSRRKLVEEYLGKYDLPVSYIGPSKKKCFPELAYNLINAYNTGVMMSTGNLIIIMNDYTWLPRDILDKFARYTKEYSEKTCVTGTAEMYRVSPPPHLDNPLYVWEEEWQASPMDYDIVSYQIWKPEKFELFLAAIPYYILEEINGFSECYDNAPNNQIEPFLAKATAVGCKFGVDPLIRCHMIDHRGWGAKVGDEGLWHLSKVGPEKGTSTKLILRENTFNLREHERGTLP